MLAWYARPPPDERRRAGILKAPGNLGFHQADVLAIARNMAPAYGGEITAESLSGTGTIIQFGLPLHTAWASASPRRVPPPRGTAPDLADSGRPRASTHRARAHPSRTGRSDHPDSNERAWASAYSAP
jgi:hypothetical protein